MARTPRSLRAALVLFFLPLTLFAQPQANAGVRHATGAAADLPLTQYVNPFLGTGTGMPGYGFGNEGGHVFPGAAYPHGMVQFSPDTTSAAGGYRYTANTIKGFSLTHFSGRGCSAYQDFPFTPFVGDVTASPATSAAYAAHFSHTGESAAPGFYQVLLDNGVRAALTVTPRTGFAVFTFPSGSKAALLVNAGGSANGDANTGTGIQIDGSSTVTGSATSGNFCGTNAYTVYFAAMFDHTFTGFGTWNGQHVDAGSRSSSGSQSGAYLHFDTARDPNVRVKVGISFVSTANALLNLRNENPGWDFQAVRTAANNAWNAKLNMIQASGGSADESTSFYTALYHALLHPNIFSDANGQYIGFDNQVHAASGYVHYENFATWDIHRSLVRLQALLEPAEVSDMLRSLVADARQANSGFPRWQVANGDSGSMIGDSADVIVATGYAFGARRFDTQAALQIMQRGASQVGLTLGRHEVREGLSDYISRGYVTQATGGGSAAITLEYATDDFAISQFAQTLGNTDVAQHYLARAQNWRNLYNTATGSIEPREANGAFVPNFTPTSQTGFREGDGAQYTWMVPFNLRGLFDAMGGNAPAIQRLDSHFTRLNAGPGSPYAFMGNEPEFEVPWEYAFAGAPYRTQIVVRRIELQLFHNTPDGLPGNDDGGAMSSWYVFAALGLYPEIPGVAGFVLGSPLFPAIIVRLENGGQVQIAGQGATDGAPYVQSLSVNGSTYGSPWLPLSAIASGGTLQFALASNPNTAWGSDPGQAPPSFGASTPVMPGALATFFDNIGISSDGRRGSGHFDDLGYSYSDEALQAAGVVAGKPVVANGVTFRWPSSSPGTADNVVAHGQTVAVTMPGSGGTLEFLGAASHGPSSGMGSIAYSDGSTQTFQLRFTDWTLNSGTAKGPSYGNTIVAQMPYRNGPSGAQSRQVCIFSTGVSLQPGKTVVSVTLPAAANQGALHIFAMAVG